MPPGTATTYRWNPDVQRYVNDRNRFVPRDAVRREMDKVADAAATRIADLSDSLIAGRIDLPTWQREMAATMKLAHVAAGAAAVGGKGQLTRRQLGQLGARLKGEYEYLRGFAAEIANG